MTVSAFLVWNFIEENWLVPRSPLLRFMIIYDHGEIVESIIDLLNDLNNENEELKKESKISFFHC